jgi:hypothetical protein
LRHVLLLEFENNFLIFCCRSFSPQLWVLHVVGCQARSICVCWWQGRRTTTTTPTDATTTSHVAKPWWCFLPGAFVPNHGLQCGGRRMERSAGGALCLQWCNAVQAESGKMQGEEWQDKGTLEAPVLLDLTHRFGVIRRRWSLKKRFKQNMIRKRFEQQQIRKRFEQKNASLTGWATGHEHRALATMAGGFT